MIGLKANYIEEKFSFKQLVQLLCTFTHGCNEITGYLLIYLFAFSKKQKKQQNFGIFDTSKFLKNFIRALKEKQTKFH